MKQTPLTHADEHKLLDFEVYKFKKKMFKLSKDLKYVRISGIEITYSEQTMAPVKLHWQFWKGWWKNGRV